jgi:hypothetical protein
MPAFQAGGGVSKGMEKRVWIQKVAVIAVGAVKVFSRQSQAEVAGK